MPFRILPFENEVGPGAEIAVTDTPRGVERRCEHIAALAVGHRFKVGKAVKESEQMVRTGVVVDTVDRPMGPGCVVAFGSVAPQLVAEGVTPDRQCAWPALLQTLEKVGIHSGGHIPPSWIKRPHIRELSQSTTTSSMRLPRSLYTNSGLLPLYCGLLQKCHRMFHGIDNFGRRLVERHQKPQYRSTLVG